MIWLCHEAPDAYKLSQEWEGLTGDSFIVDVRPMHGEIDGFLETFKYALKFSEMPLADNWEAFQKTQRQAIDKQFWGIAWRRST